MDGVLKKIEADSICCSLIITGCMQNETRQEPIGKIALPRPKTDWQWYRKAAQIQFMQFFTVSKQQQPQNSVGFSHSPADQPQTTAPGHGTSLRSSCSHCVCWGSAPFLWRTRQWRKFSPTAVFGSYPFARAVTIFIYK